MIHCTNCGNVLKESDKFCAQCGTPHSSEGLPSQSEKGGEKILSQKDQEAHWNLGCFILMIAFIIGSCGFLYDPYHHFLGWDYSLLIVGIVVGILGIITFFGRSSF